MPRNRSGDLPADVVALGEDAGMVTRERIRKPTLTAAQLTPLAKMIAQQLAQRDDGVGWREPLEQPTAGER